MSKKENKIDSVGYTLEEKVTSKTHSEELLERLKKKEEKIKFHSRRINKNTIVYCKNKERLDEYEESYNNLRNW